MYGIDKKMLLTFILAGTIGTLTIYIASSSERMKTHPLSMLVYVGIPTGLFYLYMLEHKEAMNYAYAYAFVTAILALSTMFFYLLSKYTSYSKEAILTCTFILWFVLAFARYISCD